MKKTPLLNLLAVLLLFTVPAILSSSPAGATDFVCGDFTGVEKVDAGQTPGYFSQSGSSLSFNDAAAGISSRLRPI